VSEIIKTAKKYVEAHIGDFHSKRLQSLDKLKLSKILKRKNPYLFRAKNILLAQDFIKALLDAHISSQEETIFGDFLEGLAIHICSTVYGGRKSTSEGIDLELDKESIRYIIAIKSGPNWANSKQIKGMVHNFKQATKIYRTANPKGNIRAINGCCYGREKKSDKGDYLKLCGQKFWEFISGDAQLYIRIIEPLGHDAKKQNETFQQSYAGVVNQFTNTFASEFCTNGIINWSKIITINSQA